LIKNGGRKRTGEIDKGKTQRTRERNGKGENQLIRNKRNNTQVNK
jgi:hypothetical protein